MYTYIQYAALVSSLLLLAPRSLEAKDPPVPPSAGETLRDDAATSRGHSDDLQGSSRGLRRAIAFFDDFDDDDISDWTISEAGDGSVSAEQYPGPDWSLNVVSPQGTSSTAYAKSPTFSLDAAEDYTVSLDFAFEDPIHWIEVFRNQHVNTVIDNFVSGNDWRFKCWYDDDSHLIMLMSPYVSYNIEYRVHPGSDTYDVYVGGSLQATCDCDSGGPPFPQFRLGDTETGAANYGTAIFDDIMVVQEITEDIPAVSGRSLVVMAVLLLAVGAIVLRRRQPAIR